MMIIQRPRRHAPRVAKHFGRGHALRRRAVTLIEMIVVVAVMSIVLGTLSVTLAAVMRAERNNRDELNQFQNLSLLSRQLRIDTHHATAAKLIRSTESDAVEGVELVQADGRAVQYILDTPNVHRTDRQGEAMVHRETFVMPQEAVVTWNVADDAGHSTVSVLVVRSVGISNAAGIPTRETTPLIHIEATVGLSLSSRAIPRT